MRRVLFVPIGEHADGDAAIFRRKNEDQAPPGEAQIQLFDQFGLLLAFSTPQALLVFGS